MRLLHPRTPTLSRRIARTRTRRSTGGCDCAGCDRRRTPQVLRATVIASFTRISDAFRRSGKLRLSRLYAPRRVDSILKCSVFPELQTPWRCSLTAAWVAVLVSWFLLMDDPRKPDAHNAACPATLSGGVKGFGARRERLRHIGEGGRCFFTTHAFSALNTQSDDGHGSIAALRVRKIKTDSVILFHAIVSGSATLLAQPSVPQTSVVYFCWTIT